MEGGREPWNGFKQEYNVNRVQKGGRKSKRRVRGRGRLKFSIKHRHWLLKLTFLGGSR